MNCLNEITSFKRSNLKITETVIRNLDGSSEKFKIDDSGVTFISNVISPIENSQGFVLQGKPDLSVDEIIPHLYLSSDYVACSLEVLKKFKITHMLNLTLDIENLFEKENILYKKISIDDSPLQNVIEYFDSSFEFIDNALMLLDKENNVLVHCNAGKLFSPSLNDQ